MKTFKVKLVKEEIELVSNNLVNLNKALKSLGVNSLYIDLENVKDEDVKRLALPFLFTKKNGVINLVRAGELRQSNIQDISQVPTLEVLNSVKLEDFKVVNNIINEKNKTIERNQVSVKNEDYILEEPTPEQEIVENVQKMNKKRKK
jgi:hypothetical protein